MEVNLRRTHRRVPEQLGDLVKLGTSINQIAAKGMPQLMRRDRTPKTSSAPRGGNEFVDRVREHRRTDRFPKKVHQQEIALLRPRHTQTLEDVSIDGPHHQEIQRN
jgi:hypothetical protein